MKATPPESGKRIRVVLDSTALIDALRGLRAAERIRELHARGAQPPWTTAINVEEIYRGMRPSEKSKVEGLLDGLRVAPIGAGEGKLAGEWRRDFAARGITLSQADCLIAAAAISIGATLATGNPRHFPMQGLSVAHWPSGEQ